MRPWARIIGEGDPTANATDPAARLPNAHAPRAREQITPVTPPALGDRPAPAAPAKGEGRRRFCPCGDFAGRTIAVRRRSVSGSTGLWLRFASLGWSRCCPRWTGHLPRPGRSRDTARAAKVETMSDLRDRRSALAGSVGRRGLVGISPAACSLFASIPVAIRQDCGCVLPGSGWSQWRPRWVIRHSRPIRRARPCRQGRGGCAAFGIRGRHRQSRSGAGGWLAFRQSPVSGSPASQLRFDRAVVAFCQALVGRSVALGGRSPPATNPPGTPVLPRPRRTHGIGIRGRHRQIRSGEGVWLVFRQPPVSGSPASQLRFARTVVAFCQALVGRSVALGGRFLPATNPPGTPASPRPRRVSGLRDPRSTPAVSAGKRRLIGISPAACFRFASVPAAIRQDCGCVLLSLGCSRRCLRWAILHPPGPLACPCRQGVHGLREPRSTQAVSVGREG